MTVSVAPGPSALCQTTRLAPRRVSRWISCVDIAGPHGNGGWDRAAPAKIEALGTRGTLHLPAEEPVTDTMLEDSRELPAFLEELRAKLNRRDKCQHPNANSTVYYKTPPQLKPFYPWGGDSEAMPALMSHDLSCSRHCNGPVGAHSRGARTMLAPSACARPKEPPGDVAT